MQLLKGISKIKGLIFILALAAVASLCIVSFPLSETEAAGTCYNCGRSANEQHYDAWLVMNECSGTNSQHPSHFWTYPMFSMGNSEDECRTFILGYRIQGCGSD
jgi:hypothetical protein